LHNEPFFVGSRRVLKTKGTYVVIGGPDGRWLGPITPMVKPLLLNPFVSQNLTPCGAKSRKEDLVILRELMLMGKVTPVVDRCYNLSETPEAIRYLEEGHARGKVIVTLD
jgi:NADPH:quinone reductase-like Zn-dependent oxidoreductase